MEVKISFDTEKESIENIQKLIVALQDIITKREKSSSLGNPLATKSIITPSQVRLETQHQEPKPQIPTGGQTAGGGKVIPYEDMSEVLSKIVSGRKY